MRFAFVALAMAFVAIRAGAVLGTPDPVPAATLLLPYFEVDLDNPEGMTTLIAINNAGPAATIAHVTLWTNAGVPTGAFDVPLTGYDVATFNVRDFFSQSGSTPEGLVPATLSALHTGQPDPETLECSGLSQGDNVSRGYILVDVVNVENAGFPTEAGYFANGGAGRASNDNVLWGDYIMVDSSNNFAQGELLVHIEAGADPLVTTPGNITFYGKYVAASAADNREPLPARWGTGYDKANATTELIYWRDTRGTHGPFACGAPPLIFPLEIAEVVTFDDAENAQVADSNVPMEQACGRIDLEQTAVSFDRGWLYLNLDFVSPAVFDVTGQAYVIAAHNRDGRFSSATTATVLE